MDSHFDGDDIPTALGTETLAVREMALKYCQQCEKSHHTGEERTG
jgi:hypothetical protein